MKIILLFTMLVFGLTANAQVVFEIKSPPSIKGFYTMQNADSTTHWWGNGSTAKKSVEAELKLATGLDSLADKTLTGDYTGKIAVIFRGVASFADKALRAQQAGAVAIIIVNHGKQADGTVNGDEIFSMAGGTSYTDGSNAMKVKIPVIMISKNTYLKRSPTLRSADPVVGYIGGKQLAKNDIKLDYRRVLTPARLTNVTALVQQDDVVDSLGIVVYNNGSDVQDSVLCEVLIKYGDDTLHHDFSGVIYRDTLGFRTTIDPGKSIGYITFEPFKNKENLKAGKYTLTYSAFSTIKGKEDDYKEDNTLEIPFYINDTIYSPTVVDSWDRIVFKDSLRDSNGKPVIPAKLIYDTLRYKNQPNFTTFYRPGSTYNSFGPCLVFRDANAIRIDGVGLNFTPMSYSSVDKKYIPLKDEPFKINVYEWADKFSGFEDTLKYNNLIPLVSEQMYEATTSNSWDYLSVKFDDEVKFENNKRYLMCVLCTNPNIRFAYDTVSADLYSRTMFYDQPLNMLNVDGNYYGSGFGFNKIPAMTLNVKERTNSISELEDTKNNVIVYPNPANTFVNVSYKLTSTAQPVEVSVTDITGKVVYFSKVVNSSVGTNVFGFDTETFNDGIYVVKVSSNEGNSTRKLSIQK